MTRIILHVLLLPAWIVGVALILLILTLRLCLTIPIRVYQFGCDAYFRHLLSKQANTAEAHTGHEPTTAITPDPLAPEVKP